MDSEKQPVSNYSDHVAEVIRMDPGSFDSVHEGSGMCRPFDSFSKPGTTGTQEAASQRDTVHDVAHNQSCYHGDSGKLAS